MSKNLQSEQTRLTRSSTSWTQSILCKANKSLHRYFIILLYYKQPLICTANYVLHLKKLIASLYCCSIARNSTYQWFEHTLFYPVLYPGLNNIFQFLKGAIVCSNFISDGAYQNDIERSSNSARFQNYKSYSCCHATCFMRNTSSFSYLLSQSSTCMSAQQFQCLTSYHETIASISQAFWKPQMFLQRQHLAELSSFHENTNY